jgi:hypothetical protein
MRFASFTVVFILVSAAPGAAEWQIKPFVGLTFGGSTSFIDLEGAAGEPNIAFGVSAVQLGEVFGLAADFGHAPGFFQSGDRNLVPRSGVTTLTGNVVVALPRRLVEYTLRPYVTGGAGIVHVSLTEPLGALPLAATLATVDVGGGVTGFLTDRFGLSWDVRRFQSVGGGPPTTGLSFDTEQISFWRVNMSLVVRY